MQKGIAFEQVALIVIVIVTVVSVLLFFFTQMSNVNEPLDTTTSATDFNSKIAAAEAQCFPNCRCTNYDAYSGLSADCTAASGCTGVIKNTPDCTDDNEICCITQS